MYYEIVNTKIADFMKAQAKHKQDKDFDAAARDGEMIDLWRAIKAEFLRYEKEKAGNRVTDDVEIKIISKMLQQRKEEIEEYGLAGRVEKVAVLQREYDTLSSMLPREATEAELEAAVEKYIASKGEGYELSMKDMKDVMAFAKVMYALVNGGTLAKIFKNKLNS